MSPENPKHDLEELQALMDELHSRAAAARLLLEENNRLARRVAALEAQLQVWRSCVSLSRDRMYRGYE